MATCQPPSPTASCPCRPSLSPCLNIGCTCPVSALLENTACKHGPRFVDKELIRKGAGGSGWVSQRAAHSNLIIPQPHFGSRFFFGDGRVSEPIDPPPPRDALEGQGASEAASEAVRQAVGGGCQSGWGRLLSITNAIEACTWRYRDSGWA